MADVYVQASGPWSDIANTFGGIIPGPGDTVFTNGFALTVDVPAEVGTIDSNSPLIILPEIGVRKANLNIRIDRYTLAFAPGQTFELIGEITIFETLTNTFTPHALSTGGDITSRMIIRGNLFSLVTAHHFSLSSNRYDIYGNISGVSGGGGWSTLSASGSPILNLYGDFIQPTGNTSRIGFSNSGGGDFYFHGTVFGNAGTCIRNTNVTAKIYVWEIVAPANSGICAESTVASNPIRITRIVDLGAGCRFFGTNCVFSDYFGSISFSATKEGGIPVTMVDPATLGDSPDESDVRFDVVYNFGDRKGTCHVPPPAATATGVPVDHALGTAILTKQNVQAAVFGDGIRRINLSANFGGSGVRGVNFQIDGSVVRTSTNSAGTAKLNVDPNQEYTIRVIPPVGFSSVADLVVPVQGDDVNVNIVLTLALPTIIPPAGTCALTVRVADEGGVSLTGVPVWAKLPAGYSVKAETLSL